MNRACVVPWSLIKRCGGIPARGSQRRVWDTGSRFAFENLEYR
jgi:hypothetical protein